MHGEEGSGTGQETHPADADLVILLPGDERAQKIGKAIASQAASDILHALEKGPQTSGDLAASLTMPMGTIKYHIENLLDAGLIEVKNVKYSVKGRQVKVYGLRNQLLIMAPKTPNIRSILLKYAALFGVVALASLASYAILAASTFFSEGAPRGDAAFQAEKAVGIMAERAAVPVPAAPAFPTEVVLAFFLGGVMVTFLLLLYEVAVWRRMQ
ncbi:MAG: helix-turn-helix domain-containing protein [Methanolinea sp.]|nr:helix-turn-helix domain-containing protein [Methanolinea sp.]